MSITSLLVYFSPWSRVTPALLALLLFAWVLFLYELSKYSRADAVEKALFGFRGGDTIMLCPRISTPSYNINSQLNSV